MATTYYDWNAATNGAGTALDPMNLTGWTATTPTAGNSYLFKRGSIFRGAFATVAGTSAGALLTYGAWSNTDGTDDTTKPRPQIHTTTVLSALGTSNKDYTSLNDLDIRFFSSPPANDKNVYCLGDGATIRGCSVKTNVGAVANYGKDNTTCVSNSLEGVFHSNTFSNNVFTCSEATGMDSVVVTDNTIIHMSGGNSSSHAVRLECASAGANLSNLNFCRNTVVPAKVAQRMVPGIGCLNEYNHDQHVVPGMTLNNGTTKPVSVIVPNPVPAPVSLTSQLVYRCTNKSTIGVRIQRAGGAYIDSNTVMGFLEGLWALGGGTATYLTMSNNVTNWNRHFGIHLTTDMIGCTLDNNTCSYNGTNKNDGTLVAYGRGIELSSAAGQARCANHILKRNTCNNNFNYGGPGDNGSEGVGIGIDDATFGTYCWGNTCKDNEGNGIQVYGGSFGTGTPAITDTGSHRIIANLMDNNCTNAFISRQTSATFLTAFDAHIGFATTKGSPSICANNVFKGGKVAIGSNDSCSQLSVVNNILLDVLHGIKIRTADITATYQTNLFWSIGAATSIQFYCAPNVDANSQPLYGTTAFVGVSDKTFNPGLDPITYIPSAAAAVIAAGTATTGAFDDFVGNAFRSIPSIGMYETLIITINTSTHGGRERKYLFHKR